MFCFIVVIISFWANITYGTDQECVAWFKSNNVKQDANCVLTCNSVAVTMGTFHCPKQCQELCAVVVVENISKIQEVVYYVALTQDEIKLVEQKPTEALIVYIQSHVAIESTIKVLGRNLPDDESDAYRHFVWAALITKELGEETARKFLEAHETAMPYSDKGRYMDLANDKAGINVALKLKNSNKLNQKNIEAEGLRAVLSGNLVIIKPRAHGGTLK